MRAEEGKWTWHFKHCTLNPFIPINSPVQSQEESWKCPSTGGSISGLYGQPHAAALWEGVSPEPVTGWAQSLPCVQKGIPCSISCWLPASYWVSASGELGPQWKAGTSENIIELFILIYYLIEKGNIDWELEAETGQTVLPHSAAKQGWLLWEACPTSQNLYPSRTVQTLGLTTATCHCPFPQKHHRLLEKLRISFHQFCTWIHNSSPAKQLFGRLMGQWWTEESSPKWLKISFVFSPFTYLPFSLLFWLKQIFQT